MANEAALRLEVSLPINRACDDGASFAKGALLQLLDLNKVSGSDVVRFAPFGGVAASEKISGSGITQVAVHTARGTQLDVLNKSGVSGSAFIAKGQLVKLSGANAVSAISGGGVSQAEAIGTSELTPSQAMFLGLPFARALEDATDAETFLVELL